jgi:hypothetical protein
MGTRSLTTFIETRKDKDTKKVYKNKIVTMYRQYDGYPTGHGVDLAEFLSKGKMVNGIGMAEKQLQFNGMGCLSAQVVAHMKDGSGGIYLQSASKGSGEDYRYEVISGYDETFKPLGITLKVYEVGYMRGETYIDRAKCIFEGTPQEFLKSDLLKKEE